MHQISPNDDFIDRIRARLGDRYEISRELLGGGMSRVFVAREIALDRQVVIKFLPPEIAAEANRDRFRREIQMAAKLSHPHIAPLFASAEEGELLYYTMPFIAGESLRQSLDSGKRLGMGQINEILIDVADALAYAHRNGIVHRDIKPANILREGNHAVITDFGVAKAMSAALGHSSGDRTATTSGLAFGTPAYMAPEQIAGDSAMDHRVDIYAFGLLAYELLTGRAPFRSDSPQAVLAAQLTQAPEPILPLRGDTPPVLAALVTRCLEKEASRRPPTAEAVLEVLRSVSAASGGSHYNGGLHRAGIGRGAMIAAGLLLAAAVVFLVADRGRLFKSASPVMTDSIPKVDTALVRAQAAAAKAESALAVLETARVRDSARRSEERATKQDQRMIGLLRDSISNALQRAQAESIAKAKDAELALARQQDSLNRARRKTFTQVPALPFGIAPDAFAMRTTNLGPPRRVAISIQSGLRNPAALAAAGVVRDSLSTRLRGKPRYLLVPTDSIAEALQKSRNIDTLRTWLHGDMWVTINASVDMSDSLRWSLDMRDFTAHSQFARMSSSTGKVGVTSAGDAAIVSKLLDNVTRLLDAMDRAPRK